MSSTEKPPAERAVRDRIRASGPITFAEFMTLALYGDGGYYRSPAPIGEAGDYYTSPVAHPLFGTLLALQLEQMWRLLGAPPRFDVLEPGAGDARLARDILAYAPYLDPAFAAALHYTCLDPCPRDSGPPLPNLSWASDIPHAPVTGCIVSNEFFDALPVHRVAVAGGALQEIYVTLDGDRLAESLGDPSTPALAERLAAEGIRLQEGWRAEICLAASHAMQRLARALHRGYILTIDYGDMAEALYAAARRHGTLACAFRHASQQDALARVGRQDITAHADFTALIAAARDAGAPPVVLFTQGEFLRNLGAQHFLDALSAQRLPALDLQANRFAIRDLLRGDGLGNFRVLVQAKDAPARELACLGNDPEWLDALRRRLPAFPLPLLTPRHMCLLEGRYPHLAAPG
ncbi:MAG: SAM-dependent methyltransferase [Dehalococcoidia bacterium]|nr:SAM-dependent methyltransferase [Dehalococcoidia bacterium]